MIKIIGILILSSSISVYGTLCSSALKEAIRLRYEIIQLLKSIQNGIRYGSVPIDRIINDRKFPLIEKSNFYDLLMFEQNTRKVVLKVVNEYMVLPLANSMILVFSVEKTN